MSRIAEPQGPLPRIAFPPVATLLATLKPEPVQLALIPVSEILQREVPREETEDIFQPTFGTETSMIGQTVGTNVKGFGLPTTVDEAFAVEKRIQDVGSGKKNNYFGVNDLKIIASNLGVNNKGKKKDLVQAIRNHIFTQKGLVDPLSQ